VELLSVSLLCSCRLLWTKMTRRRWRSVRCGRYGGGRGRKMTQEVDEEEVDDGEVDEDN